MDVEISIVSANETDGNGTVVEASNAPLRGAVIEQPAISGTSQEVVAVLAFSLVADVSLVGAIFSRVRVLSHLLADLHC